MTSPMFNFIAVDFLPMRRFYLIVALKRGWPGVSGIAIQIWALGPEEFLPDALYGLTFRHKLVVGHPRFAASEFDLIFGCEIDVQGARKL